jgi:hypothetical protein
VKQFSAKLKVLQSEGAQVLAAVEFFIQLTGQAAPRHPADTVLRAKFASGPYFTGA